MPAGESRLHRHLRLLGVLWLAIAAFYLLCAGGTWMAGHIILPPLVARGVPSFVPAIVLTVSGYFVIKAIASFAVGWGLLEREPWARILALILGFVALLNVPFGTALGIYTLWVLLPSETDEEYRRMARAA